MKLKAVYPKKTSVICTGDWNNGEYQYRNGKWYMGIIEIKDAKAIDLLDHRILDKASVVVIDNAGRENINNDDDKWNALDKRVAGDLFRG